MKRLGFDLILLGAPASGKDTQAGLLMKEFALTPVETGKYLRGLMGGRSSIAKKLRETTGKGKPAPVGIIKDFLKDNVEKASSRRNLIFIGNPRLKPEAQFLRKLLMSKGRDFFAVYITLPEKEIMRRAGRRNQDRIDDGKKLVRNRIIFHNTQVTKTIEYLQSLRKIRLVRGLDSVDRVQANIKRILDDYQRSRRD